MPRNSEKPRTPALRTDFVVVKGAREHNLKGVDLSFPRDSLTTFTGVSGSGKSSLAYHTIYQEGQRRFLESLSSYARQFLGKMEKPRVDHVEGLSPTVSIDQKSAGYGARSTVGTLTEILDFLRLFMARLGEPACPECGAAIETGSVERIAQSMLEDHAGQAVLILAPVVRERKGEYRKELAEYRSRGFVRARIDGEVRRLDEEIVLHRYKYHTIELVVDRLRLGEGVASRLTEAVEQGLSLGDGLVALLGVDEEYRLFSTQRTCPEGHGSVPEMEPRLFSFNSPVGACPHCEGLGEVHSFSEELLVRDPELSIREGALHGIKPESGLVYSRLTMDNLETVAEAYGFDLDQSWRSLGHRRQKVVLHGSGQRSFEFRWRRDGQHRRTEGRDRRAFPGLIPHLEHVYRPHRARHLDRYRASVRCPQCQGERLGPVARAVTFEARNLPEWLAWTIEEALQYFAGVELQGNALTIGGEIIREVVRRLTFLREVGLGYLTLDRRARTLAGGEAQRIRLAAQVGAGLRGILYVLDEPSIGLHPRDQGKLLKTLKALRDRGNTVCVVEHDQDTMEQSDFLVDIGPGAGRHGGEVVVAGDIAAVREHPTSITGKYLRGEVSIPVPVRRPGHAGELVVRGARQHNLKKVTARFPLGRLVAITGVSGSGKSTLVNHILKRVLRRELMQAEEIPGGHDKIEGLEHLDKVVEIDQAPIGRTPRSNPSTYTGIWTHVRDLYAMLPESRVRDYQKGRFSFNVKGGRCEGCDGAGVKTLEMNFLAPVEVLCEDCQGRRFNQETLEIRFKAQSVYDLLKMTVDEAAELFADLPKIARGLTTLRDVGLGYIRLGQPSTTLSGGEAQRVKLATELQRPATGRTIYLLDEPTTGLHFEDISRLLSCLQALVDAGNSVVVIEHNLDVIKCADHIIDLGPEGGDGGGRVVATGTPEELAANPESHTGRALKPLLRPRRRVSARPARKLRRRPKNRFIHVQGASVNNLKSVDVKLPLDRITVITGVSGSGKSSLAFDTLFTEGQRRFIESMSTYARRFLGRMDQAPVRKLDGLGPAIAIDQRATSRSPRSTVATTTEIHDYLRLLYARVGRPHCPQHGQELVLHSPGHIAREVLAAFKGQRGYILAPERIPGELVDTALTDFLERLRSRWLQDGFVRAIVDGEVVRLDKPLAVPENEIFLVVDRVSFRERGRIVDSAAQASEQSGGLVVVRNESGEQLIFSTDRSCPHCGHSVPVDPHPRYFSFNHHSGACATCSGLGEVSACDPQLLVNKPNKPLFRGAIRHRGAAFAFLTRRSGWYHKVATEVAKRHGFDLDQPFDELPEVAVQILLHGAGEERFDVTYRRRRASSSRTWRMSVFWKGLCSQIEEWYHNQEHGEGKFRALMRVQPCADCHGERLQLGQRHVLVGGIGLSRLTRQTVTEALQFFDRLRLRKTEAVVAEETLREIVGRLSFLQDVGLGYLTLDRSSATLSGGEAQRIRLATQLGNRLVGVLYVLDEPTVGLHPRDTELLLRTLRELRDLGNTVVVVEHDEHVIRAADHVVDMGPGAGHRGGEVVASGTPARVAASRGLTGRYLRGDLKVPVPTRRRAGSGTLRLRGIEAHNLKHLDLELPLAALTVVTGVSGSGKSSLVMNALVPALKNREIVLRGVRSYSAVVVDQSPIGTTPASNPATYTGVMDPIRQFYSRLPQSRTKGFGPGRFSFNVRGGRCDVCEGKGQLQVEMHFLADVWVTCETCRGKRYNAETLAVDHRGRNIAQVLAMEVAEALEFFVDLPRIARPLKLLADVGLGYLRLGQSANTLSGGEAQRIKLVAQLAKAPRQHNIYLLDEPTTGLHIDDVAKLIAVLQKLVDRGDTVVVIEHHMDVIGCADRVIELGPEAGDAGGEIVVAGTPEQVADHPTSHTARFLRQHLRRQPTPRSRRSKQEAS